MEKNQIIQWRREIHRHAELSFQEHATQRFICSILDEHHIEYRTIAGTGVLATIGSHTDPCVVLRADMDALPIEETSGVEFSSLNHGVMHACGHDMHTAMLLGALVELAAAPPKDRCIVGLFQPGEELHPGGATKVLAEKAFDQFDIRAFVGQHCSPEMSVGTVGLCAGEFMASTDEIHILIHGQGGHAALPALLRDPVTAMAVMLIEMKKIAPPAGVKHVLVFGRVVADGATNIIPNDVTIEGTFRTFSEQWRADCKAKIHDIARRVGAEYNVEITADVLDGYPSLYNDPATSAVAAAIIGDTFSPAALVELDQRMTAEDFGFYTRLYPSVFLRLGVGSGTKLHTGDFCPDEASLAYGVRLLTALATRL
ncbi:MAG: M20 family metallopeptidase [Mucinivorans sp.]